MSDLDPDGPVVVALGGGHGLAAALRAIRSVRVVGDRDRECACSGLSRSRPKRPKKRAPNRAPEPDPMTLPGIQATGRGTSAPPVPASGSGRRVGGRAGHHLADRFAARVEAVADGARLHLAGAEAGRGDDLALPGRPGRGRVPGDLAVVLGGPREAVAEALQRGLDRARRSQRIEPPRIVSISSR